MAVPCKADDLQDDAHGGVFFTRSWESGKTADLRFRRQAPEFVLFDYGERDALPGTRKRGGFP